MNYYKPNNIYLIELQTFSYIYSQLFHKNLPIAYIKTNDITTKTQQYTIDKLLQKITGKSKQTLYIDNIKYPQSI